MLLDDGEKLITSALSRFAANSNEVRVLVLGSKNRFTTVRPRSAGTFLISRPVTSLNESAVCKINRISSTDRGARLKRSLRLRLIVPSTLAHMIYERFYCNRRSAAATGPPAEGPSQQRIGDCSRSVHKSCGLGLEDHHPIVFAFFFQEHLNLF